jgi:riboflavin kinase
LKEKVEFTPYPGTLNIKLSGESVVNRQLLKGTDASRICPAKGYCSGIVYKAFLGTLKCAVVIPEVDGYPEDVLEIIAAVNLRKALEVKDGDEITVTVDL